GQGTRSVAAWPGLLSVPGILCDHRRQGLPRIRFLRGAQRAHVEARRDRDRPRGDRGHPRGAAAMIGEHLYHEGSRQLQDRYDSRRLADRLVEVVVHDGFTDDDRAFIESRPMFFLATADAEGRPDCSYKGGRRGFVRVIDSQTLAFPSYDGNGM